MGRPILNDCGQYCPKGWGPGPNRRKQTQHQLHLSLLPNYACDVSSCRTHLPSCPPHREECGNLRKLSLRPRESMTGLWPKLRPSERLAWEEEEGQASLIQAARKARTGEDPADKGGTPLCQDPLQDPERLRSHIRGAHGSLDIVHQSSEVVVAYYKHILHLK